MDASSVMEATAMRTTRIVLILLAVLSCSPAMASIYAAPSWSLGGIASWAQPRIASGSALPDVGAADDGDLFILASTTPVLYRKYGGAWVSMSGSDAESLLDGDVGGWQSETTIDAIRGVSLATDTPEDGEVIRFSASDNQWQFRPPIDSAATTTPAVGSYPVGSVIIGVDQTSSSSILMRLTSGVAWGPGGIGGAFVPTMVGNTDPSGAASMDNSDATAYRMFDGNTTTFAGFDTSSPWWIQYQSTSAKRCRRLGVYAGRKLYGGDPTTFTLYGSDDGSSWIRLLNVGSNSGWSAYGEWKYFDVNATDTYQYHRMTIWTVSSGYSTPFFEEIQMLEDVDQMTYPGWVPVTPTASDSSVGTTTSLVLPWNWGVSSATLTIKDGLITGVTTP